VFIGGLIGLIYAYLQPIKYVAKMTFVVEEGNSNGSSLASLAGQFGLGAENEQAGGVLSGDNIQFFLKSRSLIREVLLSKIDSNKGVSLADYYIEIKNRNKFNLESNQNILNSSQNLLFRQVKNGEFTRYQDSVLQLIEKDIVNNLLTIEKASVKSSFIEVKVTAVDEYFAQFLITKLVETASERYLESKNKNKLSNLNSLEKRADSLTIILNGKTLSSAISQQSLIDANPALKVSTISSEISSREKSLVAGVYSEVIKNLELSRSLLNQQSPVIQIVDQSTFPLEKIKISKLNTAIFSSLISGLLIIFYLLVLKWVKSQLAS
jgi:Na+-transporting NADH:ubiquinone oxidoreductase subunit NqrC